MHFFHKKANTGISQVSSLLPQDDISHLSFQHWFLIHPSSQPAVLISRLFPRLQCGSGDLVTVSPLERLEKQQVGTEWARGGSGPPPCRRRFSASVSNLHVAHLFTGCFSLVLLNQIPDSFQLILPHLRLLTADLLMSPLCFQQLIFAGWLSVYLKYILMFK